MRRTAAGPKSEIRAEFRHVQAEMQYCVLLLSADSCEDAGNVAVDESVCCQPGVISEAQFERRFSARLRAPFVLFMSSPNRSNQIRRLQS